MRRASTATALILLLVGPAGCLDGGAGPRGLGTVSGRALDGSSGQPVAGADIMFGAYVTSTGADGAFRVDRVPPGDYELLATHADFGVHAESIHVRERQTATVALYLFRPGYQLLAPGAIAIEPGPIPSAISVSWPPRSDAVSYTVYWSTSPDTLPSDGRAVIGVISPFVHRDLTPGVTYYYSVASRGLVTTSGPSPIASGEPEDGIAIHVETPHVGDALGATLEVSVRVPVGTIASVTADLGTASVALAYDPVFAIWTGTLSRPASLPDDPPRLIVTATDVTGKTARATYLLTRTQ